MFTSVPGEQLTTRCIPNNPTVYSVVYYTEGVSHYLIPHSDTVYRESGAIWDSASGYCMLALASVTHHVEVAVQEQALRRLSHYSSLGHMPGLCCCYLRVMCQAETTRIPGAN